MDQPEKTADSIALVKLAQQGDTEAFNALFKRYFPRVLRIASIRLGPGLRARLESRDVAQEAFVRACMGFERFELRHEGAFLHWLSGLVENVIRDQHDFHHAQKRAVSLEIPLHDKSESNDGVFDPPGPDRNPSQVLEVTEYFGSLIKALDLLPQESREAIVQRDIEGLSFSEIGELLGRSEDAARMLHARAKARLTALLEEQGNGAA